MKKMIETILFSARWVLPFFYIILFMLLIVYAYFDVKEFINYIIHLKEMNKNTAMLVFIEMIDMTMIANLGSMVIMGSYNSFVDKEHGYKIMKNISSGLLKVKISTSLVGVVAIALLQRAIIIEVVSWEILLKLGFVLSLFLFASLILMIVDSRHEKDLLEEERFEHYKELDKKRYKDE